MDRFVKAGMWAIASVALLILCTYAYLFFHIADGIAINLTTFANLSPSASDLAGKVVATLLSGCATGVAIRALFARLTAPLIVCGVFVVALTAAVYGWATSSWLFNERGEPIAFICPGTSPGEPLRVQRQPVDHVLGSDCPLVTPATAAQVRAQRSGIVPTEVHVTSLEILESLPRFDERGTPSLFAGAPASPSSPPKLYRTGGIDPWTGTVLKPASDADLNKLRVHLAEQARLAAARAATEQRQLANAERARERETLNAVKQAQLAVAVAAAASRDTQVNDRQATTVHTSAEAAAPPRAPWQEYFTAELNASRPMVVFVNSVDQVVQTGICRELAGDMWWPQDLALPKLFSVIDRSGRFTSRPLPDSQIFPPGLEKLIAVHVNRVVVVRPWGAADRYLVKAEVGVFDLRSRKLFQETRDFYI